MTLPFPEHSTTVGSLCGDVSVEDKKENMSSFCGDSEILLDRMIEQCQTRVTTRHPGFGRKLVPYFNDGSTESGINQQQKGESYCYSRNTQKSGQGYKRSPRSSRRTNGATSRRGKKATEINSSNAFSRIQENKCGASSPSTTSSSREESTYEEYPSFQHHPSLCSLFAGPICFNSPPPEALPMPTAVLLAKAMCLS